MNKAVLDLIRFPVNYPGLLECRLRRVTYLPNGSVLEDGSRSSEWQTGCHSFALQPSEDIEAWVDEIMPTLRDEGYADPDTTLLHMVAEHEWNPDVLERRQTNRPGITHRLAVRALGFGLVDDGKIAIGLAKVTSTPKGQEMTQKASVLLLPGFDVRVLFDAVEQFASASGYQPLDDADMSLVTHATASVWAGRQIARTPDILQIEHQQVASGLNDWWAIPTKVVA